MTKMIYIHIKLGHFKEITIVLKTGLWQQREILPFT